MSAPASRSRSNERQDCFGQTVNIAARVQGLATSREIFATEAVIGDTLASGVLTAGGITPMSHNATLKGIANEMADRESQRN